MKITGVFSSPFAHVLPSKIVELNVDFAGEQQPCEVKHHSDLL